jgi:hypothetical protein
VHIKSSCRGTLSTIFRVADRFRERSPSSRISCRSSMGRSARTHDAPLGRISETRRRLHADGQTVARSREQGHVEPDGSEVASLRRNLRGPKPSGARPVPETSPAVPTWLGSALEPERWRSGTDGTFPDSCPTGEGSCRAAFSINWREALAARLFLLAEHPPQTQLLAIGIKRAVWSEREMATARIACVLLLAVRDHGPESQSKLSTSPYFSPHR